MTPARSVGSRSATSCSAVRPSAGAARGTRDRSRRGEPELATLRLFAQAREAAGTGTAGIGGSTVGEVLDAAVARFGPGFGTVLATSAVWLNGEPAGRDEPVGERDEVAVLPPVSGG